MVIVSMSREAAEQYKENVGMVFTEAALQTEIAAVGVDAIPQDADLYLVSKGYIESCTGAELGAQMNFPEGVPVLDLSVDFRKNEVQPLFDLPQGTRCLLVNSTEMLAMECISDLHNLMGIYHLVLIPYAGETWFADRIPEYAITVGETEMVPDNVSHIINLGIRWVSPETMVEIAVNLKHEEVLESENFEKYRAQFVGSSVKVSELIAGSSYYRNIFHLMVECLEDGIIGINQEQKIFCANRKAVEILGMEAEVLIGKEFYKALPFTWDMPQFEQGESFSFTTRYKGIVLTIFVNPMQQGNVVKGLILVIKRFFEQEKKQNRARLQLLERGYHAKYSFEDIVGESSELKRVCQLAKKMAMSDSTILITGETGTGKELLASAIHNASPRKDEAYIAINCSAMSDNLLESELFGYDEGAFTGAKKSGKPGFFEFAHRGTLFLDEIEDMSPALQLKLLRVLQEKEIMHIGGDRIIKVDVRIIAATNQNLEELVQLGKIRKDLYYRLNTLQLELPPLRERREDIMPLLYHFMRDYYPRFHISEEAARRLRQHKWDGNVRELQNCAEYFACMQKEIIEEEDLPKYMRNCVLTQPFDEPSELTAEEGQANGSIRQQENEMAHESKIKLEMNLQERDRLEVMQVLYGCHLKHQRAGRKSISAALLKKDIFMSEQQVRRVLSELEQENLVYVAKGRRGTCLTAEGLKYLGEVMKSED